MNWIALETPLQLEEVISLSNQKTTLIFKHSTRCFISKMSLRNFEAGFNLDDKIDCYFLDLLNQRDLSALVAQRLNVSHQSPQLLVLKDGQVVYHTSHENINAKTLERFV